MKTRGEKQIFGPLPKAEGKSLAEDVDTRWQMDLADLKKHEVEHTWCASTASAVKSGREP